MKLVCALALLAILGAVNVAAGLFNRSEYGSVPPPELPPHLQNKEIEEQWFDQYVDHFSPQDERVFKQRWFENLEFYNPELDTESNFPIFVYIGSEGTLSSKWVQTGFMYDNAKKHNAILLALEHRYYGKSQPMENWSYENLRYLSSEQALDDLATFIRWYANNKVTWSRQRSIVVFGGSYGATLSAYMRSRHSHLIRGAVVSSAPFEPEVNFVEYYEVSTEALRYYGGDECVTNYNEAMRVLDLLIQTHPQKVGTSLNTCTPITKDRLTGLDRQSLWVAITDNFIGLVQYNKENGPNYDISAACEDLKSGVEGFFEAFNKVRNTSECLPWTFDEQVAALSQTTINTSSNMRQWIYQTCTEFGFYQTLESSKQVYGPLNSVKLDFFVELCRAAYSPVLTKDYILEAADRTREAYGGWYYQATNAALANGNIDPWHAISLFEKCKHRSDSISIHFSEGTSHCALLYPSQSYDPDSVVLARQEVSARIGEWVEANF